MTDTFFPFFASCRASACFSDSFSGMQMSGATMVRLPATRVRVGDCFAGFFAVSHSSTPCLSSSCATAHWPRPAAPRAPSPARPRSCSSVRRQFEPPTARPRPHRPAISGCEVERRAISTEGAEMGAVRGWALSARRAQRSRGGAVFVSIGEKKTSPKSKKKEFSNEPFRTNAAQPPGSHQSRHASSAGRRRQLLERAGAPCRCDAPFLARRRSPPIAVGPHLRETPAQERETRARRVGVCYTELEGAVRAADGTASAVASD